MDRYAINSYDKVLFMNNNDMKVLLWIRNAFEEST